MSVGDNKGQSGKTHSDVIATEWQMDFPETINSVWISYLQIPMYRFLIAHLIEAKCKMNIFHLPVKVPSCSGHLSSVHNQSLDSFFFFISPVQV